KAEQKHSLRRIVLIVAALGVVAIAYELLWPARVAPVGARPAVPVTVAAVASQPMPVRLDTIGTVQTIANVSVKSRIDGVITDVLIQDGQYVKTGDVMFKLDDRAAKAQLEQYRAQLDNAKADVARYKPLVSKEFISRQQYDTAVANQDMLQAQVDNFAAQLSYETITAPIDGRVGTIAIKAVFDNAQERLWPGEFVNVSVTERTDPDAITVPQSAVLIGQNTTYVYVIKDDSTAEMRPVKVARTVDGISVISAGLNPGERVATDGQLRLTTGSRVDIRSSSDKPETDSKS